MHTATRTASALALTPAASLDVPQAPPGHDFEHDALATWNDHGVPHALVAFSDADFRVVTPRADGANDRPVRLDDLVHLAAPAPEKKNEQAFQRQLRLHLIREARVPDLLRMPATALGGDTQAYEAFLRRLARDAGSATQIDQWLREQYAAGNTSAVFAINVARAMSHGNHGTASTLLASLQTAAHRDVNAAAVLQAGARAYVKRDGSEEAIDADLELRKLWKKECAVLLTAGRLTRGEHRSVTRILDSAV